MERMENELYLQTEKLAVLNYKHSFIGFSLDKKYYEKCLKKIEKKEGKK
jgi:hypothetical protein